MELSTNIFISPSTALSNIVCSWKEYFELAKMAKLRANLATARWKKWRWIAKHREQPANWRDAGYWTSFQRTVFQREKGNTSDPSNLQKMKSSRTMRRLNVRPSINGKRAGKSDRIKKVSRASLHNGGGGYSGGVRPNRYIWNGKYGRERFARLWAVD